MPAADASPVRMLDPEAEAEMVACIDAAQSGGDTLGGVVEVVARGLVTGLGSHVHWDRKLDGRLAGVLMSFRRSRASRSGSASRAPPGRVRRCTTPSPGTTVRPAAAVAGSAGCGTTPVAWKGASPRVSPWLPGSP